ncbi:hypothetical protein BTO06_17625 [Tenacibaculum sp. SZ-18]|uniref:DUF4082 domain-containing protein n=1 Tax=Tenacibaculum sp. SZ-18 TaxID=754423 RepID=UPI000C2CE828|nr:DUF4082 domain-containing protein [Tenacibaculum sp. SZ-18]AUC16852.1 hypothetical protein BTO06_17625 [Tenacibaculum sp. SZ-18]
MKNLHLVFIFLLLFTILGCSGDKETITIQPSQFPMKTLIENGILDYQSGVNSPNTFEVGYQFKTFKNGDIVSVSIRVPANGAYRVSLWNFETQQLLHTEQVQSSNGLISTKEISPIPIESSVDYFVSLNTSNYYIFNKAGDPIFPSDIGDVLVKGYGTYLGTNQDLPTSFSTTSYLGMVDIEFVPDN